MRGAGEPIFECDYPPGSDMGEITSGPYRAELMEFQLFSSVALLHRIMNIQHKSLILLHQVFFINAFTSVHHRVLEAGLLTFIFWVRTV